MKKKTKNILIICSVILALLLITQTITLDKILNQSNSLSIQPKVTKSSTSGGTTSSKLFAIGDNCVPDAGYDYCNEDQYGDAYAKIMLSDYKAEKREINGYYVGGVYENVKSISTKLFQGIDKTYNDFDSTCDYECSGTCSCTGAGFNQVAKTFKYTLAAPGQSSSKCTLYIAYTATTDNWVWVGYGFEGQNNCGQTKAVNCYDNTDCSTGQHCSRVSNPTSDWSTWSCVANECTANQEKCVGTDYYQCSPSTFSYSNQGKVVGKCGVGCTTNTQCANLNTITNNTCSLDNSAVVQYVTTGTCDSSYTCKSSQTTQEINKCQFGCLNGVCKEKTQNFIIFIIAGIVIILTMIIIFWLIRRKRGGK